MKSKKRNTKQQIYKAAVTLFSRYGFSAVSIRDIAKKAEVNSSMISYYYRGKIGILKAVVEMFLDNCITMVKNTDCDSLTMEDSIKIIIRNLVSCVRSYSQEAVIVFTEFHHGRPEISRIKKYKIDQFNNALDRLTEQLGITPEEKMQKNITCASIISLVFTHFLFEHILKNAFKVRCNAVFYEQYKKLITLLFLEGDLEAIRKL